MRFLHTSDWHIGRTVTSGQGRTGGHSRHVDFEAVLTEIVSIARQADLDLILHTGDLFDRPSPAAEDFELGMQALRALAEIAPTVVIAGNHDNPVFFRTLDALVSLSNGPGPRRLRFVDQARPAAEGGILEYPARGGQRIRLAALPFVHRNRAVAGFDRPAAASLAYADYLRGIQADLTAGLRDGSDAATDVLIFAAHMFVENALPDHTERPLDITQDYASPISALPSVVHYAALGHIHQPQDIKRPGLVARYAGSPLQMDFGEMDQGQPQVKSVVVVEANPQRATKIDLRNLTAGRRLLSFTGDMDKLARQAPQIGNAFVRAVIDVDEPTPGLAAAVTALIPDATIVDIQERPRGWQDVPILPEPSEDVLEPELGELFADYLATATVDLQSAEPLRSTFEELLAKADQIDGPATDPSEQVLTAALAETSDVIRTNAQ